MAKLLFTHFPDDTAHKNWMQGNDFVQSVMYRRGVTCFDCHDVHGTNQYAQLRKPANEICLDCHGPLSLYGSRTATLEEHTHHKPGSTGSQCMACHMPQIETTVAGVYVRAHTFRFISPAIPTSTRFRTRAPRAIPTNPHNGHLRLYENGPNGRRGERRAVSHEVSSNER